MIPDFVSCLAATSRRTRTNRFAVGADEIFRGPSCCSSATGPYKQTFGLSDVIQFARAANSRTASNDQLDMAGRTILQLV